MGASWHALHSDLLRSTQRLSFQQDFKKIRSRHRCLCDFYDVAGLLDALHRQTGDPDGKNSILWALVCEAQSNEPTGAAATTLVLLAHWPGLDAVRGRLKRKVGNPDDLSADLVGRLSLAIQTLDLSRVNRIAATLLRNVERDLIRDHARRAREAPTYTDEIESAGIAVFGPPGFDYIEARRGLYTHLTMRLGADADLVLAVAVAGYSQAEAADKLGLSYDAARKRYQRAIAALTKQEIL